MNEFFIKFIQQLSTIDNTIIFGISIVPYSVFLFYLFKLKKLNWSIKIGFSLTILFVAITILLSLITERLYGKSLVEVDIFHGLAESFLTISDLVILFGFLNLLKSIEVKNS